MTTDFRALCAKLSDALRNAIRVVYHEDGTQHISTAMPILRRARAALADEPAVPEGREPVAVAGQPSDGEVAELVAWLREQADHELGSTFDADYFSEDPAARNLNRAAELLQRLSPPQPVPVSERLPGPKDCDDQKRCWWLVHQSWPCLYLMKADSGLAAAVATHWLPAHALPIPRQQENAND